MSRLEQIEEIKRLKYRYFRALDCKDWSMLGDTLAPDATTAYDSGKYSFAGREAILGFLRDALGSPRVISLHHGHHPEIELTSESTAQGIWYLEDQVIFRDSNTILYGAGFYTDAYVKLDGRWHIQSTGYERTFEKIETHDAPIQMRTRFDAPS
jgi:SnoaL-like domain